jgi:alanyl-tRNA synthetase
VLRRLLRRAARHGRLLGISKSFLADLSRKVIESSGSAYLELEEKKDYIYKILSVEEEKFSATIDQGTAIIYDYIKELKDTGNTVLPGDKAFKLYDTYGFPLELTQEILAENGLTADVDGFNKNMLHQKEQARAARKTEDDEGWAEGSAIFVDEEPTEFVGYDTLLCESIINNIFLNNHPVNKLQEGDSGILLLNKTPFYAEGGGQVSDTGIINGKNSVINVQSVTNINGIYAHKVKIIQGEIEIGEIVESQVDIQNRNNTARNHTCTHILHKALKEVLGNHVEQAGSNVNPESLRFDFTHFEAVSKEELQKIESIVNEKINYFLPVKTQIMTVEEAKKSGAIALFDEKYGEKVRVVSVGDYSTELCGGTHITNSGQIGAFRIISENGIAAGVRRIEAITGASIYKKLRAEEELIN